VLPDPAHEGAQILFEFLIRRQWGGRARKDVNGSGESGAGEIIPGVRKKSETTISLQHFRGNADYRLNRFNA
jgi:hypothetical protein